MQYQQTPQGLAQLYSPDMPVSGVGQAMDLLTTQQNADAMTAQDQQRELDYNNAADPMRLTKMGLDNDTLSAHLPGIQAESRSKVRDDANAQLLNPEYLKDMQGKYTSADLKRHADDTETIGQHLANMGALEQYADPATQHARVRAQLKDLGHEDLYDTLDLDHTDPGAPLAKKLADAGGAIQGAGTKVKNALALAEMKGDMAVRNTAEAGNWKLQVAQENSRQRADTANKLMQTKVAIANIPKGLEDYAAKMRTLAAASDNVMEAQRYAEEAQWAVDRKATIASQSAATTVGVQPNMDHLGVTSNNGAGGVPRPGVIAGSQPPPLPGVAGGPAVSASGPPAVVAPTPLPRPAASAPVASGPNSDLTTGRSGTMGLGPQVALPPPRQGDIYKGHKYVGGDPKNKSSWIEATPAEIAEQAKSK